MPGGKYRSKATQNRELERSNHKSALVGGRYHEEVPTDAACGAIV